MICSEDSSDRNNPKGLDTSYILHRVIGCTVSWVKNAGDYWGDANGDVHLVGRIFHQVFGDSLLAVSVTIPALQETAWTGSSNDLLE